MMKHHDLRGHVDHHRSVMTVTRMFDAVVETDQDRTLMCMQFFANSLNVK